MRIFKYLALAGLVSLAACNNDDNLPINGGENGKSTTAMRLVVGEFAGQPQPQAVARAITDGQDNAAGAVGESEVKKGYFMTMSAKHETPTLTSVTGFSPATGEENQWEAPAFLYTGTTGAVNAALVINQTESYADFQADKKLPLTSLATVAKKGEFTMSSKTSKTINIVSGVTETAANAGTDNNFEFTVERLASKVQVTQPQGGFAVGGDLTGKATFAKPRYAVAGGAKEIYLFGDKAGDRQLSDNPDKGAIYNGFESAIHGLAPTNFKEENGVWVVDGNPRDVTKVSADKLTTFSTDGDFKAKQSLPLPEATAADGYKTTSAADNGIYFYENSVNTTDINYNDITHVKVYAEMLPADGAQVIKDKNPDNGTPVMATKEEIEAGKDDEVVVSQEFYAARKAIEPTKVREENNDGVMTYYYTMTNPANTFYVGADGKMYLTLSAARAFGNKTSKKYTGGKMLWKTPANRQFVAADGEEVVKYADTRRNNIYSLSITEIQGIGDNYDPVDPDDPNIEKPEDNPDEPTVDEKDPVNETKTYIKVKATILKWNLVHRGVILK